MIDTQHEFTISENDPRAFEYAFKGGKGAAPAQQPMIAPTPPVEEASVKIDDTTKKDKTKTSKASLKIPLVKDAANTGLNF